MQQTYDSSQMLMLLVEDRDDDIVLFRRAFTQAGVSNPIFVVRNGFEAARYLAGKGAYRDEREFPLPGLVLLDLKMPLMDGFELLTWIREHPTLSALRVVVVTSSEDCSDITRAAQMGANSFVVKPFEFRDYIRLAHTVNDHWIRQSIAPELYRFPHDAPPTGGAD